MCLEKNFILIDETINQTFNLPIDKIIEYIINNKDHDLYKIIENSTNNIFDSSKIKISNELVLNTHFISHRVNNSNDLLTTPQIFGVEIDLRDLPTTSKVSTHQDYDKQIILSHDPFPSYDCCPFEKYLENYNHGLLILNMKSERVELEVLKLLEKYKIENYLFLDSSIPMIYYTNKKLSEPNSKHFCRLSELEPIELFESLTSYVDAVWIDCFSKFILDKPLYDKIRNTGKKMCLVSPELQGRPEDIQEHRRIILENNLFPDMICCKEYRIIEWI